MNLTAESVFFFVALVALMVYVIRRARRWANAPISPAVNLQSGLSVDPASTPDSCGARSVQRDSKASWYSRPDCGGRGVSDRGRWSDDYFATRHSR